VEETSKGIRHYLWHREPTGYCGIHTNIKI